MAESRYGDKRGIYYRRIAGDFLAGRGSPLLLAPGDFSVIANWEKKGIPLDVVLEGIKNAFEYLRSKKRPVKGLKLKYCEPFIDRAFAQYRERKAGNRRPQGESRAQKKHRAFAAVKACLERTDRSENELVSILERALQALRQTRSDEEELERLDAAVGDLLRRKAEPGRLEGIKREAASTMKRDSAIDPDSVARTRLIKEIRERLKIPYFSLFYY